MTPHDDRDALDDPATRVAAEALAAGAVRFHPSPRFEERLASRLRAAAAGAVVRAPAARPVVLSPAAGAVVLTPAARPVVLAPAAGAVELAPAVELTPLLTSWSVGLGHAVERVPRPVLVGGAIASGVSLAGAAVVAWVRLRRSS